VLKTKAKYSHHGGRVQGVQEYDVSASNTSATMNADFTPYSAYLSGSVVADTVQIGSLSSNLNSVQVAKKVDYWFDYLGVDGSLGLAVSANRDGSSFGEQIASQLDSPVLTVYANQTFTDDDDKSQGVLSFGDRIPEICNGASWTKVNSALNQDYPSYPAFDTVSISGPASSDGCANAVTANITAYFFYYVMPLYVSVQVQEVFVKTSGARFSLEDGWYVVDDVTSAQPVKLQGANGMVLEITPDDYLLEIDGIQYLYTYGYYDQTIRADHDFIVLNQQFLNNHCMSMNLQSGEWSLTSVLRPTEIDISSSGSTSSSSSSSPEDTDYNDAYVGRVH